MPKHEFEVRRGHRSTQTVRRRFSRTNETSRTSTTNGLKLKKVIGGGQDVRMRLRHKMAQAQHPESFSVITTCSTSAVFEVTITPCSTRTTALSLVPALLRDSAVMKELDRRERVFRVTSGTSPCPQARRGCPPRGPGASARQEA